MRALLFFLASAVIFAQAPMPSPFMGGSGGGGGGGTTVTVTSGSGAPVASCSAPTTSAIALYYDTSQSPPIEYSCPATNTWVQDAQISCLTCAGAVNLGQGTGNAQITLQNIANEVTIGTTQYQLAKVASGAAINALTTDTAIPVWPVASTTSTSGYAQLVMLGQATCRMDAAGATANHFIVASTATAGCCMDAGATAPSGVWIVGNAVSTVGANANVQVFLGSSDAAFRPDASGNLVIGTTVISPLLGPIPIADWCVSSVWGDDSNDGKCDTNGPRPFATLAKLQLQTITTGQKVILFNGSTWHESLIVPANNLAIYGWGPGQKWLIDGSDPISAASFSKTGGRTNVYQATVSYTGYVNNSSHWVNTYQAGVPMALVADIATCDSTASSYYYDPTTPTTLYIHAAGDANPGSSGVLYEYTARENQIDSRNVTGTVIYGGWTRRNMQTDGSTILGNGGTASSMKISDGSKHSIYLMNNTALSNSEVVDAYWGASGPAPVVQNGLFVAPTDTVTYTNVYVHLNTARSGSIAFLGHGSGSIGRIVAANVRADNVDVMFGHSQCGSFTTTGSTGTRLAAGIANVACGANTFTGLTATATGATVGIADNGTPVAVVVTGSTLVGPGNVFQMQGTGSSVSIQNSTVSGNYGFTMIGTGQSLTSTGNTLGGLTGNYYYYGNAMTVVSDFNNFGTPGSGERFTVIGTGKTYAQWKALGYDAHSTP